MSPQSQSPRLAFGVPRVHQHINGVRSVLEPPATRSHPGNRALPRYRWERRRLWHESAAGRWLSPSSEHEHTAPAQPHSPAASLAHSLTRSCLTRTQAADTKNFDTALTKLDNLASLVSDWRDALLAAKREAETPAEPVAAPEPPAESVEFSVNSTHVPEKCPRKSEEGAVMKVHYVGKLISTGKIFASSFHTGSQPFRFVLGSDDVVPAWNQGLGDMCQGERRRLMVPWNLAYGEKGTKGVPPYSDVQYDFELVELSLPKMGAQKKGKKGKKEEL